MPSNSNAPTGPQSSNKVSRSSLYGQRTIGLLADWFDEHYQLTILRTAEEAVTQRGSSMLSFAGGIPGSNTRNSQARHAAFDLIRPNNVDGAILLAGTMVNELGTEALASLLAPLQGLPLCAIGIEVPGIPSILVDNRSGIEQAMAHLVDSHNARKVAFIRGPSKNKEAESRYAAYQVALTRANISFDAGLVFQGDFLRASGEAAVQHWLGQGVTPDAIFAANDEMALGALHALTQAGKSVPGDVALIGFDDIEGARNTTPPLTTVRQPLKDLAVASVRTIMDQIAGREVPQVQTLQTHLVVRESCGCSLRLSSTGQSLHPDSSSTAPANVGFVAAFAQRKQSLKAELQRAARGEFAGLGTWEERLIAAFSAELDHSKAAPTREFLEQLNQCVTAVAQANGDVTRWHDVVTAFRRYSIPCCGDNLQLRGEAEDLLQDARMATAYAVERKEAQERMGMERFTRRLSGLGAALTGCYDLNELASRLKVQLPSVGIEACYLSVYEPFELQVRASPPKVARLVAAFDGKAELPTYGAPFDIHQLAPVELWPPSRLHSATLLPLFLKEVDLGFLLLEGRSVKGSVLEFLREQLSIALYGALLASKVSG
jgi:phosphoserine phosphatase RsbU/P